MPVVGRRRLAVLGCLALVAAMTACGGTPPSDPSGGLAIVLGGRANMPPAAVHGVARQVSSDAVDTRSPVSVVVADGAPFVLEDATLLRGAGAADDVDRRRAAFRSVLASAAAKSPESDLLGALALAARAVQPTPGRHTILVVDSGLSTAGALDFRRPGLLDADPADLAGSLQAEGVLPDLGGVHVIFQGLGDTAAPQPPLDPVAREQLIDLWTAIALAGGALDVNIERTPLEGEPPAGRPAVSVVGATGGFRCTGNDLVLDGGGVAFAADTAAFRDPAAASATLQPIADALRSAGVAATLTGTTADVGDAAGQRRLSQQRAEAVAALLVDLGVPTDKLRAVGLGSDFPGYVADHDAQGRLLPAAAALNRKVVVELSGAVRQDLCG